MVSVSICCMDFAINILVVILLLICLSSYLDSWTLEVMCCCCCLACCFFDLYVPLMPLCRCPVEPWFQFQGCTCTARVTHPLPLRFSSCCHRHHPARRRPAGQETRRLLSTCPARQRWTPWSVRGNFFDDPWGLLERRHGLAPSAAPIHCPVQRGGNGDKEVQSIYFG